jgi:cob(I)alamin adenosyltransferase
MPKIYTKTGDTGITGLYDGSRVAKTEPIFDVLGTLDELASHIGLLKAFKSLRTGWLNEIQQILLNIGSIIATPNPPEGVTLPRVDGIIAKIEEQIDEMDTTLPPLTQFLLVGGSNAAESQAHVCRSVSRRAEREFLKAGLDNDNIRIYLNRLSDFFFTLARTLN